MTLQDEVGRLRDDHNTLVSTVQHLAIQQVELHGSTKLVTQSVQSTSETLQALMHGLDGRYAAKSRFEIVEKVVFAAAGLVLLSAMSGWVALVIHPPTLSATITPTTTTTTTTEPTPLPATAPTSAPPPGGAPAPLTQPSAGPVDQ